MAGRIVCILGTGSNSCYFDGKRIHTEIDSLGYVLMDEASGNYFGKRLLRDYFYKKMPEKLRQDFASRFNLNSDVIKQNLYKEPNPNAYLASFAAFIFTSQEVNGYFYKLISEGIQRFIEDRVLCFKEAQHLNGKALYSFRLIPDRGSWMEVQFDTNDLYTCIQELSQLKSNRLKRHLHLGWSDNKNSWI
mgnify:CR=1 FL=1